MYGCYALYMAKGQQKGRWIIALRGEHKFYLQNSSIILVGIILKVESEIE